MNENLKAILRAISEDEELGIEVSALMAELGDADDATRPEVVARAIAFANEHDLELTEEDLALEVPVEGKVEDDELAVVAGGRSDDWGGSCDKNWEENGDFI